MTHSYTGDGYGILPRKRLNLRVENQHDSLIVFSKKLPEKTRRVIIKFVKKNAIPYSLIDNTKLNETFKKTAQEVKNIDAKSLIIIGDYKEFPMLSYDFERETGYTDIIYEDIEKSGLPTLAVGRIYGPSQVILAHLECVYGDTNKAIVFDTTPRRSEMPVKALESMGFYVDMLDKFKEEHALKMEEAELILQYSDGTECDRVHGNSYTWFGGLPKRIILSADQMKKIKFKAYPFVFSEACSTAAFGPLLREFLRAGSIYYGSTTITINNGKECESWDECPFCDGQKYGILEMLERSKTVGEASVKVHKSLIEKLPKKLYKNYESLLKGKSKRVEQEELLGCIQFVLFGNPNRPEAVGVTKGRPKFKAGHISVALH